MSRRLRRAAPGTGVEYHGAGPARSIHQEFESDQRAPIDAGMPTGAIPGSSDARDPTRLCSSFSSTPSGTALPAPGPSAHARLPVSFCPPGALPPRPPHPSTPSPTHPPPIRPPPIPHLLPPHHPPTPPGDDKGDGGGLKRRNGDPRKETFGPHKSVFFRLRELFRHC